MRHLIVGIDPGKTSAIACLDLNGTVVHLAYKRFAGLSWFIDLIRATGSPVVIASDKKRPNRLVSELAAIFDAVLFLPESDVEVRKKKDLMREAVAVENLHERDALSAAKIAYFHYANKLNQAEKNAKGRNYDDVDEVKALVLKRNSMSEAMAGKDKGSRFVRS